MAIYELVEFIIASQEKNECLTIAWPGEVYS